MTSRSERREAARMEAGLKLGFFGVVALAFLIGGVSGFSGALTALILLAVVIAVAGLAGLLILKSRLVVRKKLGLLLIIGALLGTWIWNSTRAPRQWPEDRATVASIVGPSAVTETDYSFHPVEANNGVSLLTTQTKPWANLSEAKNYRAGPVVVYYNRSNPSDTRFESVNGWGRASANPISTKIRVTGTGTATLRIGSVLFPQMATTTGPHVASFTVGATIPIWIDPVSRTEMSFEPRATVGGQKYWIVVLTGALAFGGLFALVAGKQWIGTPAPFPTNTSFANTASTDHAVHVVSITGQLHAIDWFQFEAVAGRILEADGWAIQKSGGANPDGGADILATQNGRRAVVQCKHWRRIEVQPKIIRELLGTKTSAQFTADEAILFTLSTCTQAALSCAQENNVTIYNSRDIETAIQRLGIERFPELTNPDKKLCPKCGAAMVLRDKVEKPFWGCSTYPRCRGTIERA